MKMTEEYLRMTNEFLESFNIEVKDTNNKQEMKEAKSIIATFFPSEKIVVGGVMGYLEEEK